MTDKKKNSEQQYDEATGPDTAPADAGSGAELEHTAGGATTRDPMDAGVPMVQGQPDEPVGPEDAFGPGPKRGDYSDRIHRGPSMRTEVIPDRERMAEAQRIADASDGTLSAGQALAEVPATRLVPVDERVAEVGDAPGKGGVSTDAANAERAALEGAV